MSASAKENRECDIRDYERATSGSGNLPRVREARCVLCGGCDDVGANIFMYMLRVYILYWYIHIKYTRI